MRNSIFTLIASLGFITLTTAQQSQNNSTENIVFGIKAGLNMSNVYDKQGENFVANSKIGFAGGGFVNIPIVKYFAIQPEMLFSQKGFKGEGTLLGSSYSYERTTSFLDIPLLLAFKPISSFSLLFGPQYSFILSEKNTFNSATINTLQQQQFNNDNIRRNIFGLTGGADLNATENIVIGVRAGWDLQQNNGDGSSSTPRYRNVWYQATLGYRF